MKNTRFRASSKLKVIHVVITFIVIIIIAFLSSLRISSSLPSNYIGFSFCPSQTKKITTDWSLIALTISKPLSLTTLRPLVIKELHQSTSDAALKEVTRC